MKINYIVDMVRGNVKELEIDDTDTMDIVYRKVAMAEYNNVNIPIEIEHLKTRAEDAADGVGITHVSYVLNGILRVIIRTEIEPTTAKRASDIFKEGDVINVRRVTLKYRRPPPTAHVGQDYAGNTLSGGARNYRRKSKRKSRRRKSSRRKSSRRKSSRRKSSRRKSSQAPLNN